MDPTQERGEEDGGSTLDMSFTEFNGVLDTKIQSPTT